MVTLHSLITRYVSCNLFGASVEYEKQCYNYTNKSHSNKDHLSETS